jgi:hypothetical protein
MITFELRVWDGWHMIGEGFGLRGARADRFADIAWTGVHALIILWAVFLALAVAL